MSLRQLAAVWAARAAAWGIRRLRAGAGSVLPGQIALGLDPDLLRELTGGLRCGVVLVAGTNGKTTTTLLLRTMLERHGLRVVHNASGANLENGLTTALLAAADARGRVRADYALFEVDENVLPRVLPALQPRLTLCLNLFRDQLDRYGEVDLISAKWAEAMAALPAEAVVVLNADDPTLSHLGSRLRPRVLYFGLDEPEAFSTQAPQAVDSVYCPNCGARLTYRGIYYSHLGEYTCPRCGFTRGPRALDSRVWPQVLIGLYNKYNTLAAALAAETLGVPEATVREAIRNFTAAFGRAEELDVQGKHVRILLTKNPAGMNETIRALQAPAYRATSAPALLVVLNDRIPDGTDVSWIWDVDMEPLVASGQTVIVSGDRAYDLALRLAYSRNTPEAGDALIVEPDLRRAVAAALERTPPNKTLHILPTYSAMLEVRQILTGRQIL